MPSLSLSLRALRELGPRQAGLYALYQSGKKTGYFRWRTPAGKGETGKWAIERESLPLPGRDGVAAVVGLDRSRIISAAGEIVRGRVTLFGGAAASLQLSVPGPLQHWTRHETSQINGRDVKFVWEPARFGWAFTLARAYHLTGYEDYPAAFWRYLEAFLAANPPNTGPNWVSAQEVGLRVLAFAFAGRVFAASRHTTPARLAALARAIATHAARIPPTLIYARAQNNNHLLTEAAALYTAGLLLPAHPQAKRWRTLGWRWLHHALQTQIEPDGTYVQQSTNYHRLMLQIALWARTLAKRAGDPFPEKTRARLAAAARWLLALCDPETGRVPNLGPNDGAHVLPLAACPFHDYRPTLQAASRAFLGQPAFPPGPWDEMSVWLGEPTSHFPLPTPHFPLPNYKIHHPRFDSWAYLRAVRFQHRPGHADQLHLDLWQRGLNVALDPGTYLYNADPPWDNGLTTAFVHNTITVDGRDQMTRAGRFLYVDRAQARTLERTATRLMAEHDGYRALGVAHRRTVEATETGWLVTDLIYEDRESRIEYRVSKIENRKSKIENRKSRIRLHWLLPDWDWELEGAALRVASPHGWITLSVSSSQLSAFSVQPSATPIPDSQFPITNIHIFRAGETLHGPGPAHPTWGWRSPTYGVKEPALSFAVEVHHLLPITLTSNWQLPNS